MIMQPPNDASIAQQPTLTLVLSRDEVTQQPTSPIVAERKQEVVLESTRLEFVQQEVAQQPTQAVVAVQDKVAEQPTCAMVVKQHIHYQRMWRWIVPALMCLLLLGGTVIGIASIHIHVPIFS